MKRLLCVLGLAAAMSLTWGGSAFATDHDVFNKLVAKVAPTVRCWAYDQRLGALDRDSAA